MCGLLLVEPLEVRHVVRFERLQQVREDLEGHLHLDRELLAACPRGRWPDRRLHMVVEGLGKPVLRHPDVLDRPRWSCGLCARAPLLARLLLLRRPQILICKCGGEVCVQKGVAAREGDAQKLTVGRDCKSGLGLEWEG